MSNEVELGIIKENINVSDVLSLDELLLEWNATEGLKVRTLIVIPTYNEIDACRRS